MFSLQCLDENCVGGSPAPADDRAGNTVDVIDWTQPFVKPQIPIIRRRLRNRETIILHINLKLLHMRRYIFLQFVNE